MIFQIKRYIKFLIKSTNQHGVHSPFVYDLVTKCFYAEKNYPEHASYNKKQRLFLRIVDYFKPKTVWVVSDYPIDEPWKETFELASFPKPDLKDFENLLPTLTNDAVWVFGRIHENTETEKIWKQIIQHEKVTVTVDTFYFGLVFFRKEQEKEHFTIRI